MLLLAFRGFASTSWTLRVRRVPTSGPWLCWIISPSPSHPSPSGPSLKSPCRPSRETRRPPATWAIAWGAGGIAIPTLGGHALKVGAVQKCWVEELGRSRYTVLSLFLVSVYQRTSSGFARVFGFLDNFQFLNFCVDMICLYLFSLCRFSLRPYSHPKRINPVLSRAGV